MSDEPTVEIDLEDVARRIEAMAAEQESEAARDARIKQEVLDWLERVTVMVQNDNLRHIIILTLDKDRGGEPKANKMITTFENGFDAWAGLHSHLADAANLVLNSAPK